MRRTERLFQIIQVLRTSRGPRRGRDLAEELDISLRTLYRDIAELQMQGVPIDGEAGVGYVLRPGYELPPLMLTPDEIEAAILGAQWVARRGDRALQQGARDLQSKLENIIPEHLRPVIRNSALVVPPGTSAEHERIDMPALREAMRRCVKVRIRYRKQDADDASSRVIWPFTLGYFDTVSVVVAWCESRANFRHFRTDRIEELEVLDDYYPEHPQRLRKRWQAEDSARRTRE